MKVVIDPADYSNCSCCTRTCDWDISSLDFEPVQKAVSISVDGENHHWLCSDCYNNNAYLILPPELIMAFAAAWKEFEIQ